MAAEDREILREVWEGRIPVCFTMAEEEIEAERPEPVYLLVPRQSYFPLVTDKVQKHFSQYTDKEKVEEMWLEFEGQSLKWHYPIGLLFDLYGNTDNLPWSITVHFQNFPEEELLSCCSKEVVESYYMSTLKEADALKHRSQIVNSMQKKDHKQLWTGIINDKFDLFWSVNKRLMETVGDDMMFKAVPFRIYQVDKPFIQKLFHPITEEGHHKTLNDVIQDSLCLSDDEDVSNYRVVTQGIEPQLDTPLLWLSEHFSYPDNFLHICVLRRDNPDTSATW